MAITNAQQYQQLVNKPANGKRPGYKGSDWSNTKSTAGTDNTNRGYSSNVSPSSSTAGITESNRRSGGEDATNFNRDRGYNPNVSPSSTTANKVFNEMSTGGDTPFSELTGQEKNQLNRAFFISNPSNYPSYIPTSLKVAGDFNREINRKYFIDNVVRAGKIPGLNYGTLSEMSEDDIEQEYKDYMSDRLAGNIDAMGNPLNTGGDDNIILPVDTTFNMESSNTDQETTEEPFEISRRFRAEGGSIMPRLNELGTNVSSAEQTLQEINQRLQSAESTLGEGGGQLTQLPAGGLGSLPLGQQPMLGGVVNNPAPKYSSFEEAFDAYKDNPIVGKDIASGDLSFKDFSNQMNLSSGAYGMHGAVGVPAGGNFGGFGGYSFNDETNKITRRPSPQANMPYSLGLLQPAMQSPLQGSSGIPAAGYADGGNVVGGEYDFDSARQMYGLGKLVKKIGRSVKKIAKSPIGKAALLYAGGTFLGGLPALQGSGTFMANLKSGQGITNLFNFGKNKLFGEVITGGNKAKGAGYAKKGLLDFIGGPFGAITAASTVAGLLTADQEDEAQKIADETGFSIEEARNSILARAQGNIEGDVRARRFVAEGGSMDEPVAKKTMPLLDMDGQEMDLRAEGGFVPIGRMEKADDVPARLSKNEFVFTAEAVRNAGEGDVDKGAEVMYNMMKNLESGGEVSEESQGLEGAREMFQTSQRLEEVI